MKYRIKRHVPESRQERIPGPEGGGGNVRGLREEHGGDSSHDIDAESDAGANLGTNGLGNSHAGNLTAEKGQLVGPERRPADLASDVFPAVDRSRGHTFGPDDKDECNVVHPSVNAGEQVVAKLGAVGEGQQERQDGEGGDDDGARGLDA